MSQRSNAHASNPAVRSQPTAGLSFRSIIMAVFFTSDTHFGHANIIKYCGRPYRDVTQMDAEVPNQ